MKLLYLSCHSILEYDEVKLFNEMGIDVFSPGAYVEPDNPGDPTMRPGIPDLSYDPDDVAAFHALAVPGIDNKELLTKEFVDRFDVVFVMHVPKWIQKNWQAISHKPVIWRTIGQSISYQEQLLTPYRQQGMKVVRYSPKERTIPGYLGEDTLIRFYKDPAEYGSWNGENQRVITFAQHMKRRDRACNYSLFERVTRPYNRGLFGPGSEEDSFGHGKVPFDQLQQEMRNNRCYFYTGTHPASYTLNFMEAWMTGIPIVAGGSKWGNADYFPGHNLYEVEDLIEDGVTGFVSNDENRLGDCIKLLLNNEVAAKEISVAARSKAIEIFGKETISNQWKEFFETL